MRRSKSLVVFLDRDGIINRMRADYVKRWEELEILPGALETLARLSAGGCDVIVLTNQSAIGRGLVSRQTVDDMHRRLAELIETRGGHVRAFLVCPHKPSDGCDCRKPAPGLLHRARDELDVELATAVLVGDQLSDVEAARAAGCRAILVDDEGDRATEVRWEGCAVVDSFSAAADIILRAG
jgi:D-glycero-D-manno-heptose 1,7-bisphosphate phosphatase